MKEVIKVTQLSKSYHGNKVIRNLDFSVKKGEIFGLLGANGAGKTTSIECILGTKKAETGKISILGMNPYTQRKQLFEEVGVQFQEANYPEKIKVYELCEETACLYRDSLDYKSLLREFHLENKEKSFISDLSGGERQRLFIILALLSNPKVVFLDELTTGLDTKARREVWKILLKLKEKGLTIFLTSHFMDEVEVLCDKIAILKEGKFVFEGTVEEAITQSPHDNFEDTYLWFAEEEDYEYE